MPLRWDVIDNGASANAGASIVGTPIARVAVWPYRSLPPRGFAIFIGVTFVMFLMPLFPLLGTPVLWALLPFLMGALALTWFLIQRSYTDASLTEVLTVWNDRMELIRSNPRGSEQRWEANPYWVRVEMHSDKGPVENYITLHGSDRTVEFGAFLSPEERQQLFGDLRQVLQSVRQ